MRFGEHIKARRLELGLSLRAFCTKHDEDPSNWSKLERGLLPPPNSYERVHEIGGYLGYGEDSQEMSAFRDLASLERGAIPEDIASDAELMNKLPLLFRTLRDSTPTEADLMRLADTIRNANSPNG